MSDQEPTIRIRRPPKIHSDGQGRSVWTGPVEPAEELELVSTQALRVILDSDDEKTRKAIRTALKDSNEGILARGLSSGKFEIIEDADLQEILDSASNLPAMKRPADVTLVPATEDSGDELSLVSTQALRKILGKEAPAAAAKPPKKRDTGGGFDPYNSG